MSGKKVLRVAAARSGVPVASPWRFWAQGEEFYAASSNEIALGKASFHRNLRWQYRLATANQPLYSGFVLGGSWLHALHVAFLVLEDALRPLNIPTESATLIETGPGMKSILDLTVTSKPVQVGSPRPPIKSDGEIGRLRLRSRRQVVLTYRVEPLAPTDLQVIREVRASGPRLTSNSAPLPENHFAELLWRHTSPQHGNFVGVIPLPWSTFTSAVEKMGSE